MRRHCCHLIAPHRTFWTAASGSTAPTVPHKGAVHVKAPGHAPCRGDPPGDSAGRVSRAGVRAFAPHQRARKGQTHNFVQHKRGRHVPSAESRLLKDLSIPARAGRKDPGQRWSRRGRLCSPPSPGRPHFLIARASLPSCSFGGSSAGPGPVDCARPLSPALPLPAISPSKRSSSSCMHAEPLLMLGAAATRRGRRSTGTVCCCGPHRHLVWHARVDTTPFGRRYARAGQRPLEGDKAAQKAAWLASCGRTW